MVSLPNFPVVSQLTPISGDGSSPNSQFDCVPACLCASAMYLHGITQLDSTWNPDTFLDGAYPEGYRGGTDAANYVKFCASRGVRLFDVFGDAARQVSLIHLYLASGAPVVITMADPYVPASYGWTHAVVAHADASGTITVLDPYIAKNITHSDSEWEGLIRGNVLWILEKEEEVVTIDLNNPQVNPYYEAFGTTGNQWKCKSNGKVVQYAILDFYRHYGNAALCGLSWLGLPLSNEVPLPNVAGAVRQNFERGVLIYDPTHKNDNPPGTGAVYLAHLYDNGPGSDPRIAELTSAIADLTKQLTSAPNNTALQPQLDAANAKLAQFKALAASV